MNTQIESQNAQNSELTPTQVQTHHHTPKHHRDVMHQLQNAGDYLTESAQLVIENLLEQAELSQWTIGDTLNLLDPSPDDIKMIADMTGKKPATLQSYLHTSRTWPDNIRWPLLYTEDGEPTVIKYSHLKTLNGIVNDPEYGLQTALDALKAAGDNFMTCAWLERYIAVNIRGNEPKPKTKLLRELTTSFRGNYASGLFQIMDNEGMFTPYKTYLVKVYEVEANNES